MLSDCVSQYTIKHKLDPRLQLEAEAKYGVGERQRLSKQYLEHPSIVYGWYNYAHEDYRGSYAWRGLGD